MVGMTVTIVNTDGAEDGKDTTEQATDKRIRLWIYIIDETVRRQELAEMAVTRVLLMCNDTPHQGREKREGQTKGGK